MEPALTKLVHAVHLFRASFVLPFKSQLRGSKKFRTVPDKQGVNYIIKGSNAKIPAQYTKFEGSRKAPPGDDLWCFILRVPLIY